MRRSEAAELMKEHGYVLVRRGKHDVWRNATGHMVTTSRTPSDGRALKNMKAVLRRGQKATA